MEFIVLINVEVENIPVQQRREMNGYFSNPDVYFYWFDTALALAVYALSIYLFLRTKREYIIPVLFLGLFIFPLQFGIWFLQSKIDLTVMAYMNILEVFYLLFVKVCLLIAVLFFRR
ncbi:MAG: hypothetical protein ACOC7U_02440 [Spirochaetota bacterium]